jgi:hypothetical protein
MSHHFDNLRYMVVMVSEVDQVDFRQVFETSADTLRVSVDGVYTFFKWEGSTPSSIEALTYKEGEFTHSEMLEYLNDPKWVSDPN